MQRISICPKDIQQITGKSIRQCRNILNKIKSHYNKEKHQMVTIEEFCHYMGIDPEIIYVKLK